MIFGAEFVYLELAKTGTSYTRRVLKGLLKDGIEYVGQHNTFRELDKNYLSRFHSNIKFGNIRNPWDWYVSLWAYGCMKKGGLYNYTTLSDRYYQQSLRSKIRSIYKRKFSDDYIEWRNVYSDVSNKDNFRRWLIMILETRTAHLPHFKMYDSSLIGRYTFRYLNLYTSGFNELRKLRSHHQVKTYDDSQNFMDHIFRLEDINNSLGQFADILSLPADKLKLILSSMNTVNSSVREDYRSYFDDYTMSLVNSKDRLIIDKYNYSF